MISILDDDINSFELLIVLDYLQKKGQEFATIYKGNNCIWVVSNGISQYFIFEDGKLKEIQVD